MTIQQNVKHHELVPCLCRAWKGRCETSPAGASGPPQGDGQREQDWPSKDWLGKPSSLHWHRLLGWNLSCTLHVSGRPESLFFICLCWQSWDCSDMAVECPDTIFSGLLCRLKCTFLQYIKDSCLCKLARKHWRKIVEYIFLEWKAILCCLLPLLYKKYPWVFLRSEIGCLFVPFILI